MKLLVLETGSAEGGLALFEDTSVLTERAFKTNVNFGQSLFGLIDEMLQEAKLELKSLEGICVNTGPGSYTGLRVGVTAANTLSWVNKIPIIGVSALYSMAYANRSSPSILTIIYGNDRDAFIAGYQYSNHQLQLTSSEERAPWDAVAAKSDSFETIAYFSPRKIPSPVSLARMQNYQINVKDLAIAGYTLFQVSAEKSYGTVLPNYMREFEVTPKQK